LDKPFSSAPLRTLGGRIFALRPPNGFWSWEVIGMQPLKQEAPRKVQKRTRAEKARPRPVTVVVGWDRSEWIRTEEALRITRNELWRLSAEHLAIQETERRRIAAELHDGLGQTLTLLKVSLEEAVSAASGGAGPQAAKTLGQLIPQVKSALEELRRVSTNLRPSTLDHLGIVATLSWFFREFDAASPGMKLERDIQVTEADVPEMLKIAIFRIVQEAAGNVLKHARADRIKVRLSNASGALELSIEDNGQGFDPVAASGNHDFNHGIGLRSMKARAELSGGRYELQSAPGEGTRISVLWPSAASAG
jgi:signal transduction histidine kinase